MAVDVVHGTASGVADRFRRICALLLALASVSLSLALVPPTPPASAQAAEPSICSGGLLEGTFAWNEYTGSLGGTLWMDAGAQIHVTGRVRLHSSLFGAVMPWDLNPFGPGGTTSPGQVTTVDHFATNNGGSGLVNIQFSGDEALFATVYDWQFQLDVTGSQPASCSIGDPVASSERFGRNAALKYQCAARGQAADPVDTWTGNLHMPLPGVAVVGRGPGLDLGLAYNSAAAGVDGPLGHGWSYSYGMALIADPSGDRVVRQESGSTVPFAPDGSGGWVAPARFTASLVENTDGTWTFTRRHFEIFDFDASGRLVAVRDRNGYVTTLVYSGSELDYVEDSAGRRLDFTWSGGRISAVSDPLPVAEGGPRTLSFVYAGGDLVGYSDVGGGGWVMSYDASHRMLTLRKPRHSDPAEVVENQYDAQGRVVWQEDELDRRTELHYDDPAPGATRIVDPSGDVRVDWHDATGRRQKITYGYGSPDAAEVLYTYNDGELCPRTETDPLGGVWLYGYDAAGNRTRSVDPLGRESTATYNDLDQPLTVTDSAGTVTEHVYDLAGNLERVTAAVGTAEEATVDPVYGDPTHPGDVTSVVDPRDKTWNVSYDSFGHPASSVDPLGRTTTSVHNTIGWLLSTVAPAGNDGVADPDDYRSSFTYTAHGDLSAAVNPEGETTSYVYDSNRNVVQVLDSGGDSVSLTYTAADEVASRTRGAGTPDATTITYGYGPDGTLAFWESGLGHRWSYSYDALDRVSVSTDPNGLTSRYFYDPAGNLTMLEQPGGDCAASTPNGCISYSYDAAHQLTSVEFSDPATSDITAIGYDAAGRRRTVTDGTGTSEWLWDRHGRLSSHTDGSGATVSYEWDRAGNLTELLYPGQTVPLVHGYDDAGQLVSLTDWLGDTTEFDYDANGNLETTTLPAAEGNVDHYGYDRADRMISTAWDHNGSTLGSVTYTRDFKGRLATAEPVGLPGGSQSYGYDSVDQLTSVGPASLRYDTAANLVRRGDGTFQVFDPAQQLTATRSEISAVGAASAGDLTSKTLSVAVPAGTAPGDQILAVATTPANQSPTAPPAGMVEVAQHTTPDAARVIIYRKTAGADTSPITATFSGTGVYPKSLMVAVYRGVDPADPIGSINSASTGIASSITIGSIDTDRPGALLVAIEATTGNLTPKTFTQPPGMVNRTDKSNLAQITSAIGDQTIETAGPTGSRTAAYSGSRPLTGFLLALRPAQTDLTYDERGNRTSTVDSAGQIDYRYDQANRLVSAAGTALGYDASGLRVTSTKGADTTGFVWNHASGLPSMLATAPIENGTYDWSAASYYIYGPGGQVLKRVDPRPVIELVGTDTAATTGTTATLALDLPAGLQADDQILVAVTHPNQSTPTTPAGFSSAGTWQGPSSRMQLYRRAATGDEQSVTVQFNQTLQPKAAVVAVYRGVDPDEPIADVEGGTSNTTSVVVPSLTATGLGDELVVMAGGIDATNLMTGTWTAPPDMTITASQAERWVAIAAADQTVAEGPTGTRTFEHNPDASLIAVGVMLRRAASPERWYHHDQLGSTRLMTDETGNVVGTASYSAYGTPTITGETPELGFAGEHTDPDTGLVYLRARHYDPTTGQFLSRDPLVSSTHEPYAYASNSPTNLTDPSGMCPTCVAVLVGALVGGGLDLAFQGAGNLINGCGVFDDINWGSVAASAVVGGATSGIASWSAASRVAPQTARAIGFAPGEGASALTANRLQHGTRHLTDAGLLPAWRGSTSPQMIRNSLSPILERPVATFDHSLGGTTVRGFLGELNGQRVAVFVFKEGPLQGQLATSYVPSAAQLSKWGF